jgi:integrase
VLTPDARVLDPDEMQIFMKEVVRETQRVAILFDLFMGLRVGELLAAEVSDIDVKARTIKISRNITRVNTAAIELTNPSIHPLNYNPLKKTHLIIQETPKTKDSNRVIPISDGVFALLAKHLYFLEQSNWPNPNNLLFPSTKGTHIDPKSFELRLKAVSKRCEIQKVNPHALRHTFATRLVEEHIPLTTVQRLLGHASVSTTERYVSTTTEEKRKGVDSISDNWSFSGLADAKKLSGAKKRMEFNDVRLPSWLQTEPEKAKT